MHVILCYSLTVCHYSKISSPDIISEPFSVRPCKLDGPQTLCSPTHLTLSPGTSCSWKADSTIFYFRKGMSLKNLITSRVVTLNIDIIMLSAKHEIQLRVTNNLVFFSVYLYVFILFLINLFSHILLFLIFILFMQLQIFIKICFPVFRPKYISS
jgi:hypothetical protein